MADSAALTWRTRPILPAGKLLGAAALVTLAWALDGDAVQWSLALAAAAGLAAWALRDLVAPVRLSADAAGVTVVTGYARRVRLGWHEIERVRVDRRQRLGLTTDLLEVDAGTSLYFLSVYDLGQPPQDVADALAALRTGHDLPQ